MSTPVTAAIQVKMMTLTPILVRICACPRTHLCKLAVVLAAAWIPSVAPAKQLNCAQVNVIVRFAIAEEHRYRAPGGGHVVKPGSDPLNEQAMQKALDRLDSHIAQGMDRSKARELTEKEIVDECYKANPLPPGARRVSDPKPKLSNAEKAAERQASQERRLAAKERLRAAKEARRTGQPVP